MSQNLQRTDTDVQVNDIKRLNSTSRRSVFANEEYDESTTSVPTVQSSRKNTPSPLPTLNDKSVTDATSSMATGSQPIKPLSSEEKIRRIRGLAQTAKLTKRHRYTKDGQLKSRFSDVKFEPTESIFEDEAMINSHYFGFYILGWITVGVIFFNTLIHYQINHGSIFYSPIVRILMRDVWKVGLTDLAMYASTYLTFSIQYLAKKGIITWSKSGCAIQGFLEAFLLIFFIWFAEYEDYPWVGKVFLCLHSLVMLMKTHSYAFFNGYFWNIKEELAFSSHYLDKHEKDGVDKETTELLKESIEFCKFELSQHPNTAPFPANINVKNFFEYTMFPTVVYQISYPRTPRIRWRYVGSKVCGIFGIITIMIIIAQHHIFPLYYRAIALKELPLIERFWNYPLLFIDLVPPFLALYLLVWYLIWELILNAIAELSRFGDREFYGDWWNCVSWDEFARLWNIPVHKFLLRHVYHSSISVLRLSKLNATFFTFLLSSVVHELVMFVIFGKLRGYLLFLQMCQLPLVAISRSKFFRKRKVLGNIIFWLGIASGPSLMCSLYLTF